MDVSLGPKDRQEDGDGGNTRGGEGLHGDLGMRLTGAQV